MSTTNYPKLSIQNTPQFKQTNYNISSIESLIKNTKLQYGTCTSPLGNLSFVSDNSNYSISYRMTQIKKGVIKISRIGKKVKFIDDIDPNIPLCDIIDIISTKEYNAITLYDEMNCESCGCLIN